MQPIREIERDDQNGQNIKTNLRQSLQVLELILPWSLPGRQHKSPPHHHQHHRHQCHHYQGHPHQRHQHDGH